jgi:hypothetical protein
LTSTYLTEQSLIPALATATGRARRTPYAATHSTRLPNRDRLQTPALSHFHPGCDGFVTV